MLPLTYHHSKAAATIPILKQSIQLFIITKAVKAYRRMSASTRPRCCWVQFNDANTKPKHLDPNPANPCAQEVAAKKQRVGAASPLLLSVPAGI
eukprot:COSAG02_NODE_2757_length_8084_cov_3.477896_6_plen_94_part_00